jgi:predicted lipoprotein with Yx(FWY)xxD motif
MKRLLISGTAVVAATIALAACGGGGGSSPAAGSGSGTATVSAETIGGAGAVLVDPSGKALYTPERETRSMLRCTGTCTSVWVPLTVGSGKPTGNSLSGTLAVVRRPGGAEQVTYNGRPLYSFDLEQAGQVTGDGVTDSFGGRSFTWHVVRSSGAVGSTSGGGGNSTGAYGY